MKLKLVAGALQIVGLIAITVASWGLDWRLGLAVSGGSALWLGVELERAA